MLLLQSFFITQLRTEKITPQLFAAKHEMTGINHHIINSVLINSLRLERAVFHSELYYTLFTHFFFKLLPFSVIN